VAQALPQRSTSTPLYPFARHLSPSFSHSRARGTLAHSSSTPVDSTTIQSRSTRHATSFVEYGCAPRCLFLSFVVFASPLFSFHISIRSLPITLCFLLHFSSLFSSPGLVSYRSNYPSLRKIIRFSWRSNEISARFGG